MFVKLFWLENTEECFFITQSTAAWTHNESSMSGILNNVIRSQEARDSSWVTGAFVMASAYWNDSG